MAKLPMPRPALPKAPPPRPMPKPHTLAMTELNDERRDKRTKSTSKLDVFYTEVSRRYLGWSNAVLSVGSAYKKADDKYRETLGKQTAKDALEIQIFFSVLTVATSGALGWISYAAAKATGGVESALRDAVESSIQATAGEVFSANGPLLFPPSGDGTISPDPQTFQNDLQKRVNNVYRDALHVFGDSQDKVYEPSARSLGHLRRSQGEGFLREMAESCRRTCRRRRPARWGLDGQGARARPMGKIRAGKSQLSRLRHFSDRRYSRRCRLCCPLSPRGPGR